MITCLNGSGCVLGVRGGASAGAWHSRQPAPLFQQAPTWAPRTQRPAEGGGCEGNTSRSPPHHPRKPAAPQEDAKKKARAERFGLPVKAEAAKAGPAASKEEVEAKKKARAERFGLAQGGGSGAAGVKDGELQLRGGPDCGAGRACGGAMLGWQGKVWGWHSQLGPRCCISWGGVVHDQQGGSCR